uniref:Uncharacterized protein n=1 Tax=Ciona intestinalis TaxID=7719 RepID=H2Y069_CIOIN
MPQYSNHHQLGLNSNIRQTWIHDHQPYKHGCLSSHWLNPTFHTRLTVDKIKYFKIYFINLVNKTSLQ